MFNYSCSIDTLSDYKIVKKIFHGLGNKATKILFQKLLPKLKKSSNQWNISKIGLRLSFVNSINWIDGIVVGVEAPEQLEENINNHFYEKKLI